MSRPADLLGTRDVWPAWILGSPLLHLLFPARRHGRGLDRPTAAAIPLAAFRRKFEISGWPLDHHFYPDIWDMSVTGNIRANGIAANAGGIFC